MEGFRRDSHIYSYLLAYMDILLQNYGLVKQGKHHCINFSVPEVKILILLSSFVILGVVVLVNLSINITDGHLLLDGVISYITCQLGGYDPGCEDIREEFEKHLYPGLEGTTYLLLGLVSFLYLLFAIHVQDVKRLFQIVTSCYHATAKSLSSDKTVKFPATSGSAKP